MAALQHIRSCGVEAAPLMSMRPSQDIRDAFNLLDKDGSGFISSNELKHVVTDFCGKLTDTHVNQVSMGTPSTPRSSMPRL